MYILYKNMIKTFFVLLLFLFLQGVSYATNLQSFIDAAESRSKSVQGSAFAVLKDGIVIHKSAFGRSKVDGQKSITSKSLFPVASLSKAITALAVAKLVDEEKLNLDEKVLLSCLKNPTTLREILNHTTGYEFSGNSEIESGFTRYQLLNKLKKQNPTCNHCYFYNNMIFSLVNEVLMQKGISLQIAIDKLSKSLRTDEIQLTPVKSGFDIVYRHSNEGTKEKSKLVALLYSNYQTVVPASAAIYASLDAMIELLKLASGYRDDIISQKTLKQLFIPNIATKNDIMSRYLLRYYKNVQPYYGLGWRVVKSNNGRDFIFHSGKISGMWAIIGFIPSENIGIVFMENGEGGKTIFNDIMRFMVSEKL